MRIRCLSVHASYACAHAGACCSAGWPIPVEDVLIEPLHAVGIHIGPARMVPARTGGECVFFEADAGRLCAIHRRGGPSLLPSACRHFPRLVVNDPRGTSITLSHFCPTAADLLFGGRHLAIVDAPPGLALGGSLEGLDATAVLPPLLSPGVLTDWEGYSAWEDEAVALFDIEGLEPDAGVAVLVRATDACRAWTPATDSLAASVRRCFAACRPQVGRQTARWGGFGAAICAYLAAHAFASWAAYEPDGLPSVPAAVADALVTLERELHARGRLTRDTLTAAIRASDLRLRHAVRTTVAGEAGIPDRRA